MRTRGTGGISDTRSRIALVPVPVCCETISPESTHLTIPIPQDSEDDHEYRNQSDGPRTLASEFADTH